MQNEGRPDGKPKTRQTPDQFTKETAMNTTLRKVREMDVYDDADMVAILTSPLHAMMQRWLNTPRDVRIEDNIPTPTIYRATCDKQPIMFFYSGLSVAISVNGAAPQWQQTSGNIHEDFETFQA